MTTRHQGIYDQGVHPTRSLGSKGQYKNPCQPQIHYRFRVRALSTLRLSELFNKHPSWQHTYITFNLWITWKCKNFVLHRWTITSHHIIPLCSSPLVSSRAYNIDGTHTLWLHTLVAQWWQTVQECPGSRAVYRRTSTELVVEGDQHPGAYLRDQRKIEICPLETLVVFSEALTFSVHCPYM